MSYAIPAIGQEAPELLQQQSQGQLSAAGMPYYLYEKYQKAIGQQRDAFHKSQEPERSFLFMKHRKRDGFMATLGKSLWNAGVAGPVNFIQKQIYNKEEGFFRLLKTAGVIVGFGAVMAAGMAMAPMLTTAGLALVSAVGVGVAGMRMLKHGASWVGNVIKGDYKDAVEEAHDLGDAATEGAMAAVGLRQTTSMAMRLNNVEGTSAGVGSSLNIRGSFRDMFNTLFRRNYWRDALTEVQNNIHTFRQDVMLNSYSGNGEQFTRLLSSARQGGQDVLIESPTATTGSTAAGTRAFTQRVYQNHNLSSDFQAALAEGNMIVHRPLLRQNGTLEFIVEVKTPSVPDALIVSQRASTSQYFSLSADALRRSNLRIAPTKMTRPDGTSYHVDTLKDVGVGLSAGEDVRLATDPLGRLGQQANFMYRGAVGRVQDMRRGLSERLWGESLQTRMNRQMAAQATEPNGATHVLTADGGGVARVLTDRRLTPAEFETLRRMTDGMEPAFFDKLSGVGRTILDRLSDGFRMSTTQHNVQNATHEMPPHVRGTITTHLRREIPNLAADDVFYVGSLAPETVAGQVYQPYYVLVNEGGALRTRLVTFRFAEGANGSVAEIINANPHYLKDALPDGGTRSVWRRVSDWLGDTGPHNRPSFNVGLLPERLAGETALAYASRLVTLGHFRTPAEAATFVQQSALNYSAFVSSTTAATRARLAAISPRFGAHFVNQNLSHFGSRSNLYSTVLAPLMPGYKGAAQAFDLTPEPDEDATSPASGTGGIPSSPAFGANPFSAGAQPLRPSASSSGLSDRRLC